MKSEPTTPLELNALDREYIFLTFALMECGRAKSILDEVARLAGLREVDEECGIERREWLSIFDNIRAALHFAGSVSRIFFPPQASGAAGLRGDRLRQLTGIGDHHPIKDRALRNHIEHMDERMDEWTAESPRPFMTLEMTIDEDMFKITRDAVEASSPFLYYSETQDVVVFGDRFNLSTLKATLEDVRDRIVQGLKTYHLQIQAEEAAQSSDG